MCHVLMHSCLKVAQVCFRYLWFTVEEDDEVLFAILILTVLITSVTARGRGGAGVMVVPHDEHHL